MSTHIVRVVVLVQVLAALIRKWVPLLVRLSAAVVLPSALEALVWVERVGLATVRWMEETIIVS